MEKRSTERPGFETAKSWVEQRKQKPGNAASFAPHTPPLQRSVSTFSSPGSILGKEEDAVIIELTPKRLYAGIEGDSGPQCMLNFNPEDNRRIGDNKIWMPAYRRTREKLELWGDGYELWRNHLEDFDLGLMSDVLERTVREAYHKHLLVDAGSGRLVLVLPSLLPHPVLETILSTLFQRWRYPSITLLPSPTMAVVAAGLRSGLVVDIGWEETNVTAVYEYREVTSYQTTRAMKMLSRDTATVVGQVRDSHPNGSTFRFDLDIIEEILMKAIAIIDSSVGRKDNAEAVSSSGETANGNRTSLTETTEIDVEWPCTSSSCLVPISKHDIVKVLSDTFLGQPLDTHFDDHELPLPRLIFHVLQSLTPDLRGMCMSRIVFTGCGPDSSWLRHQIPSNVEEIIQSDGWGSVRGRNVKDSHSGHNGTSRNRSTPADAKHDVQIPAGKDKVEEKIQKQKAKLSQPREQGSLRTIHSLGSWAGASLLTSLKIRGFVEVDRDRFLSHGLSGASRDNEVSIVPLQRMSSFGLPTSSKPGDRTSWTLGGWA